MSYVSAGHISLITPSKEVVHVSRSGRVRVTLHYATTPAPDAEAALAKALNELLRRHPLPVDADAAPLGRSKPVAGRTGTERLF